jgi:phospholipase A1
MNLSLRTVLFAALLPAAVTPAVASDPRPDAVETCGRFASASERLACYDELARSRGIAPAAPATVAPSSTLAEVPTDASRGSILGDRWAIGASASLFDLRPHEPTYVLLGRYSDRPNQRPSTPTRPAGPVDLDLDDVEAKFQVSFKVRVADFDNAWLPDLWVGYTQQSQWQVYNKEESAFFRNTDHSPELMLAWHPDVQIGPLRWRLLNVGFLHQSNGRTEVLSRSWNRIYAQFGLESGNLLLLFRPWIRVEESNLTGDNPDITDYMGHGDVVLSYRMGGHALSLRMRQNFSTSRGYAEASWSFPLARRLSGYVQATSGYGESLIDYNWRQNTIGIGVSLFDWQ